jgi:hypothetical protein
MNGNESNSPTTDNGQSGKRKSSETQQQQRAKRNRYISIACNECKRRKIKCNGQTPCQRCGNLSLECLYAPNCCNSFKDSEYDGLSPGRIPVPTLLTRDRREFKQMIGHITTLQSQVDQLYSNLNALRAQVDNGTAGLGLDASPYSQHSYSRSLSIPSAGGALGSHRQPPTPKHPKFRGPTSAVFNLGVAKSSLQNMGITGSEEGLDEGITTHDETPSTSPPPGQAFLAKTPLHASKDAIWSLSKEETIRLVRVWQDEMGTMYPIVDIDRLIRHANLLFTFMDAARRSGLMEPGLPGADAIYDDQTVLLKLIVSIALTLEASGKSDLGRKMWECVKTNVEAHQFSSPDLKSLQMLALAVSVVFKTNSAYLI